MCMYLVAKQYPSEQVRAGNTLCRNVCLVAVRYAATKKQKLHTETDEQVPFEKYCSGNPGLVLFISKINGGF